MTGEWAPADQAVRDRIEAELGASLFVEAGAGAGKTTALVSRIVALIASGRAKVEGIAAITFTEAAAAELRERVREGLERRSVDGAGGGEAERCRAALENLESASIQTLHSFAGALLRERPLEAGLPPGFEVADPIASDLSFDEAWQAWLDVALDSVEAAGPMRQAIRLGLRPDHLHEMAKIFHDSYDRLDRSFPAPAYPEPRIAAELAASRHDIGALLDLSMLGEDDSLFQHGSQVADLAGRLAGESDTSAAWARLSRFGKLSFGRGRQSDWREGSDGVNGCKALKALLQELEDARADELGEARAAALLAVAEQVRRFVIDYAERRRREGRAEFHDLLVWARNLLRDHAGSRRHFQRRYSHILIDEFQDTDPIQAEIAFLLAGDPDGEQENDWKSAAVVPGKLFVVGDPKQSIYRFRRADIAALGEVRERFGNDRVSLTQNFRSQEPVIRWANHVFRQYMTGPAQAAYEDLEARWTPPQADPPLGVHRFGTALATADEVRKAEASAVAGLISEIERSWRVRDRSTGRDGVVLRPARLRDVCILMPTRANLRAIEYALEDARIAYRVESQTLVLATQDVREVLNCLRAVDSPADQVAIAAALRSTIFGCSDVELLEFADAGGRFNYFSPGHDSGPVADALATLLAYHRERTWTRPDALVESLVRERQMVEAAFGRPRPRERWRRLRWVADQARAYVESSGSSLRGFLDWIERQAEEGAGAVEVPVPEADEDAVRIMTVHASKGLEFPIVILAGLGAERRARPGNVIFPRDGGAPEMSFGGGTFHTPGWDTAKDVERDADAAEGVRLAYVAATRAEDHLVLSLFRSERGTPPAARIEELCEGNEPLWRRIDLDSLPDGAPSLSDGASRDLTAPDRERWIEGRAELVTAASTPDAVAATTLAQQAKEERDEEHAPYRRGRGGTSLGRAVHGVLQSIDLATGAGIEAVSRAQAAAEGIADRWREVASLAQAAVESALVKRAVASGRYYRELYVSTPAEDRLLEGFVDLLFEEDGELVLVDYKTDALEAEEEPPERYRLQGGAYALAARNATGRPIKEVSLLFLQPARAATFTDVDALCAEAEAALAG